MAEELLSIPVQTGLAAQQEPWTVVARSERVNRDWQRLIERAPENAACCYAYLRAAPMTRYPGRVFPLRGKLYRGVWEYEVARGDRLYYRPDPVARKVIVYYAGPHVDPAPAPPR